MGMNNEKISKAIGYKIKTSSRGVLKNFTDFIRVVTRKNCLDLEELVNMEIKNRR